MFGWSGKDSFQNARPENGGATNGLLLTGQSGFVSGTHVASNLGWRSVEELSVGDKVLTFDHDMQTITNIQRQTQIICSDTHPNAQSPLLVPKGALHNRRDMWLMPDQGLMIETESTLDPLGDPFAVIPAAALHGFRNIKRASSAAPFDVTILTFEHDEVIYVECGMLAYCPKPRCSLTGDAQSASLYDVMSKSSAEFLVECLKRQDSSADAVTCDPAEIAFVANQRQPAASAYA